MVLAKDELPSALKNEIRILLHLASKVQPSMWLAGQHRSSAAKWQSRSYGSAGPSCSTLLIRCPPPRSCS